MPEKEPAKEKLWVVEWAQSKEFWRDVASRALSALIVATLAGVVAAIIGLLGWVTLGKIALTVVIVIVAVAIPSIVFFYLASRLVVSGFALLLVLLISVFGKPSAEGDGADSFKRASRYFNRQHFLLWASSIGAAAILVTGAVFALLWLWSS